MVVGVTPRAWRRNSGRPSCRSSVRIWRGDGGLGEPEQRGGAGEGAGPVHRDECAQQGQIHAHVPSLRRRCRPDRRPTINMSIGRCRYCDWTLTQSQLALFARFFARGTGAVRATRGEARTARSAGRSAPGRPRRTPGPPTPWSRRPTRPAPAAHPPPGPPGPRRPTEKRMKPSGTASPPQRPRRSAVDRTPPKLVASSTSRSASRKRSARAAIGQHEGDHTAEAPHLLRGDLVRGVRRAGPG